MPPVGFEPKISAVERPQTYVLDRTATGTGIQYLTIRNKQNVIDSLSICGVSSAIFNMNILETPYYQLCQEFSTPHCKAQSVVLWVYNTTRANKNTQLDATINRNIYFFAVQTLLNMFRALPFPSSGSRQTAVAASGFRMNVEVEVFSADHG